MAYKISLSERQREHIVTAMYLMKTLALVEYNNMSSAPGELFDTEQQEFDVLLAMFEELPQQEKECPNCLHGFAL